jgi:hypothetical protein
MGMKAMMTPTMSIRSQIFLARLSGLGRLVAKRLCLTIKASWMKWFCELSPDENNEQLQSLISEKAKGQHSEHAVLY